MDTEEMKHYRDKIRKKAEWLKTIGNPIRLCLIKKLCEHERCNVSYFTDCMDVSQSSVSQHLGKMRDLGILTCQKEGQNVYYSLANEEVRRIVKVLFEGEQP